LLIPETDYVGKTQIIVSSHPSALTGG